jgi:hypothetical protein
MTAPQKDLVAGALLLFFVVSLLGGWVVLRLTVD